LNGKHPLRSAAMVPVLFMALGMTFFPSIGISADRYSAGPGGFGSDRLHGRSDFESSTMLVLYIVKNGKVRKSYHSEADLFDSPEIRVDGYVAGIVAFTDAEQDIYVDSIRLRKVSRKKDGGLVFNHYGKANPEEIFILESADNQDSANPEINRYFRDDSVSGYSFFPIIPGDAVSPDNRFSIDFVKHGNKFEVRVLQKGYVELPAKEAFPDNGACKIRYLGDRFDFLERQVPDFEERIDAIVEGIAEVEKAFEIRLVRKVNVVDCDGIHNALTRAGHDDIWFFVETFKNEPVYELKTIARHEVLHLLVDKYDFTKSTGIREIFADLKGYDALSFERFFLVTQGKAKNRYAKSEKNHPLFAFVNEKNFLPGSKGGHSQDNLDEFCTSFLHSLMYSELIGPNLDRSLELNPDSPSIRLGTEEKREILDYYRRTIESFIGLIEPNGGEFIGSYLKTTLARVEGLVENFAALQTFEGNR
jgi:hypothetical protein